MGDQLKNAELAPNPLGGYPLEKVILSRIDCIVCLSEYNDLHAQRAQILENSMKLKSDYIASGVIIANVILFLGLAYLQRLSMAPEALPFIDFWGRLTVYSIWVIGYEFYRSEITS